MCSHHTYRYHASSDRNVTFAKELAASESHNHRMFSNLELLNFSVALASVADPLPVIHTCSIVISAPAPLIVTLNPKPLTLNSKPVTLNSTLTHELQDPGARMVGCDASGSSG